MHDLEGNWMTSKAPVVSSSGTIETCDLPFSHYRNLYINFKDIFKANTSVVLLEQPRPAIRRELNVPKGRKRNQNFLIPNIPLI